MKFSCIALLSVILPWGLTISVALARPIPSYTDVNSVAEFANYDDGTGDNVVLEARSRPVENVESKLTPKPQEGSSFDREKFATHLASSQSSLSLSQASLPGEKGHGVERPGITPEEKAEKKRKNRQFVIKPGEEIPFNFKEEPLAGSSRAGSSHRSSHNVVTPISPVAEQVPQVAKPVSLVANPAHPDHPDPPRVVRPLPQPQLKPQSKQVSLALEEPLPLNVSKRKKSVPNLKTQKSVPSLPKPGGPRSRIPVGGQEPLPVKHEHESGHKSGHKSGTDSGNDSEKKIESGTKSGTKSGQIQERKPSGPRSKTKP